MAAADIPGDPISAFTKTHRVVLLIDLNPLLLHRPNPTRFLSSLLASLKTLTSFPPLSSFSLFAARLFFSSLSPLFSTSKLPSSSSSLSLSFNSPEETYATLSQTLASLSFDPELTNSNSSSRESNLTAAMRQLVHDYGWEKTIGDRGGLRSNLVLMFSPVIDLLKCEGLGDSDKFCERLFGILKSVDEMFVCRDIHSSWVDVRYGGFDRNEDEATLKCKSFERRVRGLGWGFCSSDSIVLGSAVVPFGLIYPEIRVSDRILSRDSRYRDTRKGQLSLEIEDVKGKPLECKFCEVGLVDLGVLRRSGGDAEGLFKVEGVSLQQTRGYELKRGFFRCRWNVVLKFQVKALQKESEFEKFKGELTDPILVYEVEKDGKEVSGGLFADKVLDMLSVELGEVVPSKLVLPLWQMLLSFIYREGFWAVVSISKDDGEYHTGILKPFTVSSALLFIMGKGFHPDNEEHDIGAAHEAQSRLRMNDEMCELEADWNNFCESQTGPSPCKYAAEIDEKKTCSKRSLRSFQYLTWSSFCKAAFKFKGLELEEVYFARKSSSSKKLKFLKCWMKQIRKLKPVTEEAKVHQVSQTETNNRLDVLHNESEQPMSSSGSVGKNSFTEDFGIHDEAAQEYGLQTSEDFFNNLSNKIQQGVESEALDLGAFTHRLVSQSIYLLSQKHSAATPSEDGTPVESANLDDSATTELLKLLLRDPKDMAARHKNYDLSSQASYPGSEGLTSETVVREYELQILFRMEILQSEVGASIKDAVKQKFVKHICALLEIIRARCHLEGGFFGDWTLENYAGKIIKSRYCETLEDVVHKIYSKMDLLLFDDEEELPNSLFISEDSNHSFKEKPGKYEVGENRRTNKLVSAEDESPDPKKHRNKRRSGQVVKQEDHARKLIVAQQSRERARRFASFTSRVPDLQRVWAPKQPKGFKPKSNIVPKPAKRKNHTESHCERVLETPMTENKRIHINDEDFRDWGSGSVCKSLFQDD